MIKSVDPLDRIVERYLDAVARAGADLPAGRRADLIADLREHIAVARAELDPPTEAALRTMLDRLGEPTAIAEEARLAETGGSAGADPGVPPASTVTEGDRARRRRRVLVWALAIAAAGLVLAALALAPLLLPPQG
jgi:hypothetical protein